MKKADRFAGIAVFLITVVLAVVPAFANTTATRPADAKNPVEEQVQSAENALLPVQPAYSSFPAQTAPNKTLIASEAPAADKNISTPPETAPNPQASPSPPPQRISNSSGTPAGGAPPLLNDAAYASNKTALKAIGKSIDLFKDRIKERFTTYLERSARYIEIMKEILKERNLPEELVFLPIVESGFNPQAYSRSRAVGPWQFIASTGKRYGLVIDWWRDERKDPVKSTIAAAEYLKDLYKMFGSWNLALAAYNAGEGKISKALKKSDSDDYWSLLNTKQIRNETKEYVPHYIAATMIANSPEEYGFNDLDYREPLEYDEVTINSPLDIDVIAKCAECTVNEIREMNPELRRWSTPPNVSKYTIRIPAGSKELFQKNLVSVPKGDQFTVEQYTLKKGDTLKKIAKKTGVPTTVILAMNSLSGLERLGPGKTITLPPKEKFYPDLDDKACIQKVAYKKKSADRRHHHKKGKKSSSRKSGKSKGRNRVRTKKA